METAVIGEVIERVRQMAGYEGEYQHTIDEIREVESAFHQQVHRLARTYMERSERYLQFGGKSERDTSYEIAHLIAVAALTLDGTADAVRECVLRVWTNDCQARDRGELPPLKASARRTRRCGWDHTLPSQEHWTRRRALRRTAWRLADSHRGERDFVAAAYGLLSGHAPRSERRGTNVRRKRLPRRDLLRTQ